ncbi:HD family phosphohydrolase [Halanaerobium praevalens]|uniref:7TM receptor with intracellular metal dependent phosphohydrolase n=1 Tax=Halanaerobium praevalens (strain ATCC 33744 / DSM 2228 / GSL) TaxID=572479 RepID=E3DQ59_HALPG|nr:HDIG domain-containing metalloprotein [Halanaerobium praevalens]ADO76810.1 7TM receptor with intracellular metal dependent phosphohydrolase [Halanaerobium praevalens DSM 2228]
MKIMKKLRLKIRGWRKKYLDFSNNTYKIIWALFFFVLISLSLSLDLIPNQVDLRAGQVSQNDITAPRTITFVNEEKTSELQREAAETAPRVYEEDSTVKEEVFNKINNFFESINQKRESFYLNQISQVETDSNQEKKETDSEKEIPAFEKINFSESEKNEIINLIKKDLDFEIKDENLVSLIVLSKSELKDLKNKAINILEQKLDNRILPSDLVAVRVDLRQQVMEMDLARNKRLFLADLVESVISANMFLNQEATAKRREKAVSEVEPVKKTVRQGEIIVRKGDVVTEVDIKVLEKIGMKKSGINYYNIAGRVLISFILFSVLGFYFYKYQRKIWTDNSKLILIELLILIVVILSKILILFQNPFVDYLVPTAMASILLTVLIGSETAVISTLFISLLIAPVYDMNFNIVLTSFLAGLIGIFSVTKVKERGDIIRAGLNISFILAFLIGGLSLLQQNQNLTYLIWSIGAGIVNGLLVGILANGLLPYLEDLFDLTSSVKLLELSNPSQPILKRMLVEAPGTYHHSVIVGNLAETAAEDVGANSLLARAAAYYHDIGKLKRPYFFSDNQFGGENPHDKTSPNLSALIIKSHVKDGVELAEKNGLPAKIIDIIKQHHGTNLISYFYQQALQTNKHDDIEKKDFRYDGPKPQSREAAIIMLADITEAAVRSKRFNKNNHDRIEGFVRGLVKDKLIENQLDQSNLTLSDLDTIVKSFVKVLTGIYHQRVEYPEKLLQEMKGGN